MVYSIIIVTNFMKIRIHTLIMLINCDFCGVKSRALPTKILSILLYSLPSTIFSVMDTDSLVALALETFATIPP